MIAATSAVVSPIGNSSTAVAASSGGRPPLERGVEVGERGVVGLEGLEAADLERAPVGVLEDDRGRGVADRAVAFGVAALDVGGGAVRRGGRGRGRPRRPGGTSASSIEATIASASRPVDRRQRRAQVVGLVEQAGGRELHQLDRPQRRVAERGVDLAGGDDRPAGGRGARHPRLHAGPERHPEAALELAVAGGEAARRVAALFVAAGVLAEPDQDQAPVELVAEAPAQPGDRRARGVGPGTARVGEVPGDDRFHLRNVS